MYRTQLTETETTYYDETGTNDARAVGQLYDGSRMTKKSDQSSYIIFIYKIALYLGCIAQIHQHVLFRKFSAMLLYSAGGRCNGISLPPYIVSLHTALRGPKFCAKIQSPSLFANLAVL